jgi:uncharacterized protein
VVAGALVQSGAGFGLGLVAGPVVTLLDPSLMPGSMIVVSVVLPLLTLSREVPHTDWRGFRWAFAGRVVGTGAGVWVVSHLSQQALGVAVGIMVLVATGLTVRAVRIRRTPTTLVAAGMVGGVSGTATSIGGPPVALVYQQAEGPQMRATLAVFFLCGGLLSLAFLAVAGELSGRQVLVGAELSPCVLIGFGLSAPLRGYLDRGRTRAAVVTVAAVSALVLIGRNLL